MESMGNRGDNRYLMAEPDDKSEESGNIAEDRDKYRDASGRDEEMIVAEQDPEHIESGAKLTRLLLFIGILGVVIFSVAALYYVISGTNPFPAIIF